MINLLSVYILSIYIFFMQTQVKEWGNSQGIRLPKEVLKSAGFTLNEVLDVTISNGVITWDTPEISPAQLK